MERLPGDPLGDAPLTDPQTASLAEALRRLYDVPLVAVRAAGVSERRYGPTSHAAATVRPWLAEDLDLAACQDAGLVREAVDAALVWLDSPVGVKDPVLSAVGIADLNPANVLWDGERCRLVDFEDGGLSEPAYELADHVEHIGTRLAGLLDAERLVDAVGLDAAARARFAAYRPLWASFWLAMLLPGNGGWRRNPPGSTELQARHVLALL
jgi:Ser/Thr protein kinase RdoA (MazF antagonist)